jgi:hypothetical protein
MYSTWLSSLQLTRLRTFFLDLGRMHSSSILRQSKLDTVGKSVTARSVIVDYLRRHACLHILVTRFVCLCGFRVEGVRGKAAAAAAAPARLLPRLSLAPAIDSLARGGDPHKG